MSILSSHNCFTPKSVADSLMIFRIPIYQRLFVWEEKQIVLFLNDLFNNCDKDSFYYIGMITCAQSLIIKNNYECFEVVDGQQRLTMIMLLAIWFSDKKKELNIEEDWNSYICCNKEHQFRIEYCTDSKLNLETFRDKLQPCMEIINNWFSNLLASRGDILIKKYSKYVFEHLAFFLSCLPSEYESYEINQYFETMNSSGKNLEQHDIVKIDLLNNLGETDIKEDVLKKWNRVSNFSILYESKGDNSDSGFKKRLKDMINGGQKRIEFEKIVSVFSSQDQNKMTIRNIVAKQKQANIRVKKSSGYDSVLSFPEFLIQVLYHFLGNNEQERSKQLDNQKYSKEIFFNPSHLKDTFDKFLLCQDDSLCRLTDFMKSLVYYRSVLDSCFIRVAKESSCNKYVLENFPFEDSISSSPSQDNWSAVLMMYESMLYVNYNSYSTYYFWFNDLMDYIDDCVRNKKTITAFSLFNALYCKDRERNNIEALSLEKLKYPDIDRYWFWYLDFVLWYNRKTLFVEERQLELAEKYIFRTNRSIEHVSPQTPKDNATINLKEDDAELNSFGNLCMISSGLNSSLRNQVYSMKRAYVISLLENEIVPHIESLKLLEIYKEYEEYLKENGKSFESEKNQTEIYKKFIANHGEKMLEKLQNSRKYFKYS